jgi:hypothetical protein
MNDEAVSRVLDAGDEYFQFALQQIGELCPERTSHATHHAALPVYSRVAGVDAVSRAAAYVAKIPGAVSGQNGHDRTFHVACVLVKGFGLSRDEAWPIITTWNATCEPPWTDRELQHKLRSAESVEGQEGYLLQSTGTGFGYAVNLNGLHSRAEAAIAADEPLVFVDAWAAASKPKPHKDVIIEGLLRRGEVGNVIAATKAGKSWFALQLLIAVASGRDWLGRRCARGPVLLVDNELHPETLENRLAAVGSEIGMDVGQKAPFEYCSLRGNWRSVLDLAVQLPKRYQPGQLSLIVLDAKYRFLSGAGFEENSNDSQTIFHNQVDRLAAELNCGIVMVHHASKGDQSGRSVVDVGSGGGAQARAADLHCVLREHEIPGCAVLQAAVRSFPPVEPATIRFDWPTWCVVDGVAPKVAQSSKRAAAEAIREKLEKHLTSDWVSVSKLAGLCGTKPDRESFRDVLNSMQEQGLVELRSDFKPKNCATTTEGVRRTSDN